MPIDNGIGHSGQTPSKQAGLEAILRQHIQMVRCVTLKHPYFLQRYVYIDANAGDGKGYEGCDGSPLVFLKVARSEAGLEYDAHLVEREPGNASNLASATKHYRNVRIYNSDNVEVVPEILARYSRQDKTFGLVYTDPNGLPDFDMLSRVARIQHKMEILIRYAGTSAKRNKVKLIEKLERLGKQVWIVRDIDPSDRYQWTFLLGTNYNDFKAWRRYGFHRVDEERGLDIIKRVSMTNDERARQSPLFDTPEKRAHDRAGGWCEACHSRAVTEIHHLRYAPPPLTDDDVIAVCHECHCKYEWVER